MNEREKKENIHGYIVSVVQEPLALDFCSCVHAAASSVSLRQLARVTGAFVSCTIEREKNSKNLKDSVRSFA